MVGASRMGMQHPEDFDEDDIGTTSMCHAGQSIAGGGETLAPGLWDRAPVPHDEPEVAF